MDKFTYLFLGLLIFCLNLFVSGEDYGIKITENVWKFGKLKLSWISNCKSQEIEYRITYKNNITKNNVYSSNTSVDLHINKAVEFYYDAIYNISIFNKYVETCKSKELIIKTPSRVEICSNLTSFNTIDILPLSNCTNATQYNIRNCVNRNCIYMMNQTIQFPITLTNCKPNTRNGITIEYHNNNDKICLSNTVIVNIMWANIGIKSNVFISESAVLNIKWESQYNVSHYNIWIFQDNSQIENINNVTETTYMSKIENYSTKNMYNIKIEGYLDNVLVSKGEENGIENITFIKPIIEIGRISLCVDGKIDVNFSVSNFSHISNNYFYIVIVDNVDKTDNQFSLEEFIKFKDIDVNITKWIATEKKFTNKFSEIYATIGDGLNIKTMLGNFNNKPLYLDKEYQMILFVYSRYEDNDSFSEIKRSKIKCSGMSQPTENSSVEQHIEEDVDDDDFPLILTISIIIIIILLVIAGVAFYRYKKKMESLSHIIEKIPIFKPHISDISNSLTIKELDEFLRTPNISETIIDEYKKIPRKDRSVYGRNFTSKNRYVNALPISKTRVLLERRNNLESEYINANYVTYLDGVQPYIATQGPKPETFDDFWRMMWEQKADTIVMLTNLLEKGVKKCDKYWPDLKDSQTYGNFTVYCNTIYKFSQYECRIFTLHFQNSKREITQFHYTHWPDHELPIIPHAVVEFITKVRECGSAPVVVHCSAGIGRTGSFILCNLVVQLSRENKHVDIPKMLCNIRECRLYALNDREQYKLCYCVINELLNGKDMSMSVDNFISVNIKEIITLHNNYVNYNDYWLDVFERNVHPYFYDNINKNRNPIPYKSCKSPIFLPRNLDFDDNCDYINAVNVDENFICTQQPLPNTIGDFWRLVDQQEAVLVVSLHEINPNFNSLIFWPTALNFPLEPVNFLNIDFVSKAEEDSFVLMLFRILNRDTEEIKFLHILHFKKWDSESFPKENDFLNFYQTYLQVAKPGKIILTCIDGAKGCGVFLSFLKIMEQIKQENVFDACRIIRSLRYSRDDFMRNYGAFEYIYNVIQRFIINENHCYEEILTYSNIS